MRVSISYFDQMLGKRESQNRQVFIFAEYKILRKWSKFAKIAKFNTREI